MHAYRLVLLGACSCYVDTTVLPGSHRSPYGWLTKLGCGACRPGRGRRLGAGTVGDPRRRRLGPCARRGGGYGTGARGGSRRFRSRPAGPPGAGAVPPAPVRGQRQG